MRFKERTPILFIFGVIFLALALQGCDPSYCASEFIVTKFNDTNDGVCDGDCSLREAVIGSNVCSGTQTIRIPAGAYDLSIAGTLEDLAATGDLDVTHDAIIIGEGAPSIDGNSIDRVFEIHSSATVEISTVMIEGGEEQVGAGIRNHGSLTMHGGVVVNNNGFFPEGIMGGSSGGGIFSDGTLVLENTQVRENSADMGGGIEIVGPGTLDMTSGMIVDNVAHDTGGGLAVGTGAEATLTEVDIWRNETTYDGGGIFNGGTIYLNQSAVYENTSGYVAGGLVNYYGGAVWATDTRFEDNEAEQGGAIQTSGLVTLYESSITNNHATNGAGGGVYIDAGVPGLHLRNCTVSNNTASAAGSGGGIHNDNGDVWLEWTTVAENSPFGIANTGVALAIENSIVAYNTAGNCTGMSLGSGGYNIEDGNSCNFVSGSDLPSTDPLLGPLANNGGLTPTHALLSGSPAIDSATPDTCTANDQRGVSRPQGPQCDRGAYEKDVLVPAIGLTPITAIPLQMGEVTGRICYPSEFIPPMTLYFEDVDTNLVSQFDHSDGSDSYSVNLFPGTYVAYAYRTGTNIGGSYSEAVLCGLSVNCTDHTLIEFDVLSGQTTMDIDICDYYGEPGDIPVPVGIPPTETPTPPAPISINFNADSYSIKEGKCTTLRWAVENAEDVFLDGELVEVPGARQVCPNKTTQYTLLAMSGDQEEEAYVTIEVLNLPEPPEPPARLSFERVCNTKIYRITLTWLDRADNETGYRVYRDGKLIATLGANSTSYVDNPPFGGPYTYAVEAFNDGGASSQVTVQPEACNPVR